MNKIIISVVLICLTGAFSCDDDTSENNSNNSVNNTNNTTNTNNTNNINNTNNTTNINNVNNVVIIPKNESKTENEALGQIFPNAEFEASTVGDSSYYIAKDAIDASPLGVAIVTSNMGFDGMVTTMTGISENGETLAIETITQHESWWYAVGLFFFTQFEGINFSDVTLVDPAYDKGCTPYSDPSCSYLYGNIGDVDAVSGATFTSDAIIKNITDSYLIYDQIIN